MARNPNNRLRVELRFRDLDDPERHAIAAGIAQLAPASPLYAGNPSIQASVAALAKRDATLAQSNTSVVNDKQKLKADTAAETTARTAYDGELHNLATLTGNAAAAPADITALGLTPYVPAPVASTAPEPPDGIDVTIPKKGHGKATVSARQPRGTRRQYVVQWSPDPVGATTWTVLVGTGKTRTLTGASGTNVWVRFATVRGEVQSAWSTPILVTIP
jgi:hypothetical protein